MVVWNCQADPPIYRGMFSTKTIYRISTMSNWTKTYGYDGYGRKSILVTEKTSEKTYTPLFVKFSLFCMKLVILMVVFGLLPLALLIRFS